MVFNKKFFTIFAVTFFLILGIIFRLKLFLVFRPLWLDEVFLFHNIFFKNYSDLFGELQYAQSAPPFFLLLQKSIVHFFGINEKTLRFIPLLCSLISLPIFYIFSKNFLKNSITLIAANALFAINVYCIFYAQEFKQYSIEMLCFMLLFMILNNMLIENFRIKEIITYCAVTLIFPLFSLSSYFLICAWVFREAFMKKKEIVKLIIIQIPMFILMYFYYTNALRPQRFNILNISYDFWKQGFLSTDIINNFLIIKNAILYYFMPCTFYITLLILLLLGFSLFCKDYKDKEKSFLINIVLVVIFASLCQIYPLKERSILFMIPAVIIFVTKGLDLISTNKKILSAIIIITFLLSFHNYNTDYLKKCFKADIWSYSASQWPYNLKRNTYPNPKKAFKFLKDNYNPNDIIIINDMSKLEFDYYKIYYNFNSIKEKYTHWDKKKKAKEYKKDLDKITEKNNHYWLFYYTDFSENKEATKGLKLFVKQHKILIKKPGVFYIET